MLTSKLESTDTVVIIGATTTPVNLLFTGVGLIVVQAAAEIACALSIGNKVFYRTTFNRYNKYKKQFEKDQATMKSFDKL